MTTARLAINTTTEAAAQGIEARVRQSLRRKLHFALACAGLFFVWLLVNRASPASRNMIGDVVSAAVALLSVFWSWQGGRAPAAEATAASLGDRRRKVLGQNLVSLNLVGFAAGSLLWAYYELVLHQEPFPSWADAGYLTANFCLMAGILLLPGRPLPAALRGRVFLDSLMTMTALFTFSWYFLLGPAILGAGTTPLTMILSAAYPLCDLTMLFCVLVLAAQPQETELRRARTLLSFGLVAYVGADATFGYLSLQGTYASGHPIDVGWVLANFLIALGVAELRAAPPSPSDQDTGAAAAQRNPVLWRSLLPYSLVPAVIALVIYTHSAGPSSSLRAGVDVGAALLIGLILLRQVFAMLENNRLYRFLQDAYREVEINNRSLAEANARLEALATTDGMTRLPNHRTFQERLRAELARAAAGGTPLSLLLLDVDRFKQYNDTFGHPAGDETLRLVGDLLRENTREPHLPARYGGEEFAVLLPGVDEAEARRVAERLRAAVEDYPFPHRPVTLSIGVSGRAAAGDDPEALIESADFALYAAKRAGRNRVMTAAGGPPLLLVDSPGERGTGGWNRSEARRR